MPSGPKSKLLVSETMSTFVPAKMAFPRHLIISLIKATSLNSGHSIVNKKILRRRRKKLQKWRKTGRGRRKWWWRWMKVKRACTPYRGASPIYCPETIIQTPHSFSSTLNHLLQLIPLSISLVIFSLSRSLSLSLIYLSPIWSLGYLFTGNLIATISLSLSSVFFPNLIL